MAVAVFDLDGTIYFERRLADGICEAVASWRARGHVAVVATGKSPAGIRDALGGTAFHCDYFLASTGAAILDAHGNCLLQRSIPTETVHQLRHLAEGLNNVAVYASTLDTRDGRLYDTTGNTESSVLDRSEDFDPATLSEHTVTQVPFWVPGDEEKLLGLMQRIASIPGVTPVRNQDFIDVVPEGINKGAGVQWLLSHLELGMGPLYTFGDSWNDLTMHAVADRSFSLPWSPAAVKNATDEVIDSVSGTLSQLLKQSV
ncbi:HAD-IIB family hydrolase [Corynebacterium sp. H128]|uniref:HAD-IIB family hydrolase n=1 Tax=Corynebacterium sp. H128 TaxID=3133427 RepID=UPI00309CC3F3